MIKFSSSPRINHSLYEMGIYSYYDVINYLPYRYEDFTYTRERGLVDKQRVVLYGEIITLPVLNKYSKVQTIKFDLFTENKNYFSCVVFNQTYILKAFKIHDFVTIVGTFNAKNSSLTISKIYKNKIEENKIKPIYHLPSGISNYLFSNLVKKGLSTLEGKIPSLVPFDYIKKYRLNNKEQSLHFIHFPSNRSDIKQALRYLKYEEALTFSIKNQIIKEENKSLKKIKKEPIDISLCQPFINNLPFLLTNDQINASQEIIEDMNQSTLMYRLLQGDVGSGKTVVAFIAMYANNVRGDQSALLAPTDALARQHYQNALTSFSATKLNIRLLVGSTPKSERELILDELKDGYIDILIGTHAIYSKDVIYSSLGLVIIDEQHRFGVNQRLALLNKGDSADLLMMSATPIPRSLALSIFGDLDISSLYSFPSKKRNVTTEIISSVDEKIFEKVDYYLSINKKIYIVAPLIEYRDDERYSVELLFELYKSRYQDKVGLLHGKMNIEDKKAALNNFYNGLTPILVTTPVIEVGIDVKEASLMIIYDATNFGLASLHQLRGRIGRDGSSSLCLLTYDEEDSDKKQRLEILTKTEDGFAISEEDLKNRGPGELVGIKQSGMPEFHYLNAINDYKIFIVARDDAKVILKNKEKYRYLIERIKKDMQYHPIKKA